MFSTRQLTKYLLTPVMAPFVRMPGRSFQGPLLALNPAEKLLQQGCERHVRVLCEQIGERHIGHYQSLVDSADYLVDTFRRFGYEPKTHAFTLMGKRVVNIEAERPGSGRKQGTLLFGAHYDSIPGCLGADDNASGVAGCLELARLVEAMELDQNVRFVMFANEEHPSLPPEQMGSYLYAMRCKERGEKLRMFVLEMLGFHLEEEGSQRYPFPFNAFYPQSGNFIAFVGNWHSRDFVRASIAAFRQHARFPSEGVAAPELFKDISRSDHWGFWQAGYQAIMVTDTAEFRNPYYHTELDVPDTLNFAHMARIVNGLAAMVRELAGPYV